MLGAILAVLIVVREIVAGVACPVPPPVVERQEDGTYRRVAVARRMDCTVIRDRHEVWSAAPEEGGAFLRLEKEEDRVEAPK